MRTPFIDLDIAREVFYADCDESVATAAVARLTPQSALLCRRASAFPNSRP